jgi:hypothetical protein
MFPQGIDTYFMIKGHTGDDMDAKSATVRYAVHTAGDWWSPFDVFDYFPTLYPRGCFPRVTVFSDFQLKPGCGPSPFLSSPPMTSDHFLHDWETFFAPYCNNITGFTDKMVSRTEDSIHHWRFRLDPQTGKCVFLVSFCCF